MKRKKKKKLDLFHLKDPQMRDSQRSRQMVLLMYSIRDMAEDLDLLLHSKKFNLQISLQLVSLC